MANRTTTEGWNKNGGDHPEKVPVDFPLTFATKELGFNFMPD